MATFLEGVESITLACSLVVLAFRTAEPTPTVGIALGTATGAVAGWLWQPCVGEQRAEILNRAETERLRAWSKCTSTSWASSCL